MTEIQRLLMEYACLTRTIDGYNDTVAKLEECRREVVDKLKKFNLPPDTPEPYKEAYNKIMDKIDRIRGCIVE